ncbi:MAG: BamA/TamA family outer membrane protein [Gammaproteobacteria bacterium]|nr:BamA/TamA family outer membrane protein [Gammaproteobacteria bacterium]
MDVYTPHNHQPGIRGTLRFLCCIALVFMQPCVHAQTGPVSYHIPSKASEGFTDATIGDITLNIGGIFDLENPEEDKLFYQLVNKLHMNTRPHVIQQQLLFATGDRFSAQALQESERLLRKNRYIQEAEIEAFPRTDGVVDINVNTNDTWTLVPKLTFSHKGGKSTSGIGAREMNLFGRGIGIEALYRSDIDRDSKVLKIVDHHVGNSWYRFRSIFEDNSDGYTRQVEFGKPFYSLNSTSMHGISVSDSRRIDSIYERGEIAAQYDHLARNYEIHTGWSGGLSDGWSRRITLGLAYDERRFSALESAPGPSIPLPADRKLLYPFIGYELVQDKFEEAKNFDQIGRTEDRFLGTSFNSRLGLAGAGMGSDRGAVLLDAGARTSITYGQKSLLALSTDFNTRYEGDEFRNLALAVDAKFYKRQSENRLLYARLNATYGRNLDLEQPLYLGGDNGLRGYPLRYQVGDRRALLTIEQRYYTDWYPLRLFRVGAAVFFDAGQTWGDGPLGTGSDGLLRDVGAGLRLGQTRSGLGRVIHIDVAYPLDAKDNISSVQFLVELKQSF